MAFSPENAPATNVSQTLADSLVPVLHSYEDSAATPRTAEILLSLSCASDEDREHAAHFSRTQPAEPPTLLATNPQSLDPIVNDVGPEHNYLERRQLPPASSHHRIDWPEDNERDSREIAFFLRQFSEGPSLWMSIVCDNLQYFGQQVLALSRVSPLLRYSACALAAKQIGQMKDPKSKIRRTHGQTLMLEAFSQSQLDFLWYGAKYYEKAIRLLAAQISCIDPSSTQLSPSGIYQSGPTPPSQWGHLDDDEDVAYTCRVLAACILCQYEDLSATMKAWSGHLDGIFKLLRPHLNVTASYNDPVHVSQPTTLLNASFWYFALHDVLEACESPPVVSCSNGYNAH